MNIEQLRKISGNFKISVEPEFLNIDLCNTGHINHTYILKNASDNDRPVYVLQNINTDIFKKPEELMENVVRVTDFLREKIKNYGGDPERETLTLVKTVDDKYYYSDENGLIWRIYKYIQNAVSYQSADKPGLFYNSAYAFGNFQRLLSDFPAEVLHETIPNFHNTVSRIKDFKDAVKNDISKRASQASAEIDFILAREGKCDFIVKGIADGKLPLRVTHNDTKLNNIMMDEKTDKGICVIDLDTVMPGSVLYDFGDSIRFGASSAAEDETCLDKVFLRLDLFEEYTKGFIEGLGGALTEYEIRSLPMGAYIITLENGMRFLGDHLNGDTYFAIHRKNHNLDRARTQLKLVADMESKMDQMNAIVEKYIK